MTQDKLQKSLDIAFVEKNDEQQLVYGIVLEPDTVDAQNDVVKAADIETAAHNFMMKSQTIGKQHQEEANAKIVESYIAPADFMLGAQAVKKGSWVMVTKVLDAELWQGVKKGDITGYSIGGYGKRTPLEGE